MKKKLLSVLLTACMVVSLTACGSKTGNENPTPTTDPGVTADPGNNNEDNPGTETTDKEQRPSEPMGQLIVGDSSALSGDWEGMFQNNGADAAVRALTTGYSVVAVNQTGEFFWDENVVADHKETENEDGTKTFEITLHKDLVYNDGTPITAKDYAARIYFYSSVVATQAGARATAGMSLVGYDTFRKAVLGDKEAKIEPNPEAPFAGIRLLDEYTLSFTVAADQLPYFYEITYADSYPFPMHVWLPDSEVKDDGEGVYFTNFTYEKCKDQIENYRFYSDNRVSSGPYTLKSYDKSSQQAILEVNPNYKGNFEGQKPLIKTLIYVKAEPETQIDALKTGSIDILRGLSEGAEIDAALDLVQNGGFAYSKYDRSGYGKLQFVCDFGPTQFTAVRQAVAYLLDRNDFAKAFTGGYGSIVHGPYATALWQYQEAEEVLEEKLNAYNYSLEEAIKVLEQDGWVYAADGTEYKSGIRHKKVTEEEAGTFSYNVTLADGTILMPLIIDWAASTGNPVTELLKIKLVEKTDLASAGMQINQIPIEFTEMLNYIYRDGSQGDKYAVPTYGMFNLATSFVPTYDQAYEWSSDPEKLANSYNQHRLFDDKLDQLSMDMVYKAPAGDNEAYLKYWVDYIVRWNELLPEIPLYSNIYHDVYVERLKDYNPSALWTFEDEIIYSYVTK